MKIFFWIISCMIFCQILHAQVSISGKISDSSNAILPFATIYEDNSSNGTTTNENGHFEMQVEALPTTIVVQYVGYQTQRLQVNSQNVTEELLIALIPATYNLDAVTIAADAEDPAYRVIRAAISARNKHLKQFDSYTCNVYIKGNQKIYNAPKKILGQDIGDFDGALDSSRTGIVYLSESLAKYHFLAPDHRKEVMISSKVSGNDRGYSFNSATEMEVNFYKNSLSFNREIVSPIADNALFYYTYILEGTYFDEKGRLINKIAVQPKRSKDPVFSGMIYIIEDQWNIHSLELSLSKNATHIYFIDNLSFTQIYVPLDDVEERWGLMTSNIAFDLDAMGLKLDGLFTAVYSDYDLDTILDKDFFGNALLTVDASANKKDDLYWDQVRPVPLTIEESTDYVRRDSISELRESPSYLDSVDRVHNAINVSDFITGYGYRKQKNLFSIDIKSPVVNLRYNPVHGYNTKLDGQILKYYDKEKTRRLIIWPSISYGFGDNRIRYDLRSEYRFNRLRQTRLGGHVGNQDFQYNTHAPVSDFWNSLYSLIGKENYLTFYNKRFAKVYGQQEIANGVLLKASLEYADRQTLENQSDISYFNKEKVYRANVPYLERNEGGLTGPHSALVFQADLRLNPGQKYFEYPDRKFIASSKYPALTLHYSRGLGDLAGDSEYNHVGASVQKEYQLGIHGYFQFYVNGGLFFGADNLYDNDRKYFNSSRIHIASSWAYTSRFLRLHPYALSSMDNYMQVHVQHDFEGWILDKIPVLNGLGWSMVAGAKYLQSDATPYFETHIGIDNMGFGIFRLLRLDLVWSKLQDNRSELGFLIGVKI